MYIEAPNAQSLAAYQQYATAPFISVLSTPPFYANKSPWLTGIKATIYDFLFAKSPSKKSTKANADAVAIPLLTLNHRSLFHLKKSNKKVVVFTPNNQDDMQQACDMGVDVVITDFPNLGACD